MRPIRTRLGFLVFALTVNLLAAGAFDSRTACACSCAGTLTPVEELEASDAVFSGEVVSTGVDDPEPQDNIQLGGVEFRVKESWKGVSGRSAVIYGQGESYYGAVKEGDLVVENSCDYEFFARGNNYLVYAYRAEGEDYLKASVCSGTKPLTDAEEDLRALGPPNVQLPDTGGSVISPVRATTVAAVLALLVVAGGLLVVRRLS